MTYLKKLKIKLVPGEYKNPIKGQVRDPKHLYKIFKNIKDQNQETLFGVYLDNDLEIRAYDTLSIGGESVALVLPEEVFERAILLKSKMFILIHNHPSGNPQPSKDDREVMDAIIRGAKELKRILLDFIIVGDKTYWSMFEEESGGEYGLGAAK